MPRIDSNGITLEYETFGSSVDPAMLLIMGYRTQMTGWHEELCDKLASRGFHVIRFDNRDVGLSTKIEGRGEPDVAALFRGDLSSAVYTLDDMAKDACGLLDGLGIRAAHVVGASMGGMIAQLMAIQHPTRVLSLASLLSTTGDRSVGSPSPKALAIFGAPVPTARAPYVEYCIQSARAIGSTGFPIDEPELRLRAGRAFDRGFYPPGVVRHFAAVWVAADRTQALSTVTAPTVVIHGTVDPLVTPSGGEATARAIPGARAVMIPGMGHDLPRGAWPAIVEAIVENAGRASASLA